MTTYKLQSESRLGLSMQAMCPLCEIAPPIDATGHSSSVHQSHAISDQPLTLQEEASARSSMQPKALKRTAHAASAAALPLVPKQALAVSHTGTANPGRATSPRSTALQCSLAAHVSTKGALLSAVRITLLPMLMEAVISGTLCMRVKPNRKAASRRACNHS